MSKKIDETKEEAFNSGRIAGEADENQEKIIELGIKLEKLREAHGISISDVANQTKIQKHFIAAMEEGKLEKLPKGPYLRSFLRQYCSFLSAEDLWKAYDLLTKDQKVQFGNSSTKADQVKFATKPREFKLAPLRIIYLIIILSLLAAAFITWHFRSTMLFEPMGGEREISTQSSAQSEDVLLEDQQFGEESAEILVTSNDAAIDLGWMDGEPLSPAASAIPAKLEQDSQLAVVKTSELRIIPTAVVWIKVTQADEVLFEGLIKPGEEKTFTATEKAPLRLKSGKPGNTSLEWQNSMIEPMGTNRAPIVRFYWFDGRVTESDQN